MRQLLKRVYSTGIGDISAPETSESKLYLVDFPIVDTKDVLSNTREGSGLVATRPRRVTTGTQE